jgi:cell wall-associated NlpC family hydrolase
VTDLRGSRLARVAAGVLACVALSGSVALSGAAPASAAPTRDINQVRNQVRDLQDKAEAATERYNEAAGKLADVQAKLDALKGRAAAQRNAYAKLTAAVNDLARSAYTSGGFDTGLQVLLADDPNQFLQQASTLQRVAASQTAALRRTQTARLRLKQTEAEVADQEHQAQQCRDAMASAKREADAQLSQAQAILASLVASERRRLAALAAAERRASSASAAHARGQLLTQLGRNSSGMSPRAVAAVRYALNQVGDRYVAAQAGPSAFDCSGLTLAAWRAAGIALPHYSYSQFNKTQRVSLSQARPGDLLFFFKYGTHHVSMYIGNGKMVHAANPSSGVIVTSVYDPWYSSRFSGVGRVGA